MPPETNTPVAADWMDAAPEEEPLALLALEDGAIFHGHPFGAVEPLTGGRCGEVIFNTSMTGYQEVCTDPSYRGQMVLMTYPLIGNYGVTAADVESRRPWLSALLVRERCEEYSNWRATTTLHQYLAHWGIPGIYGLDTRALTRHLRASGTLRGVLRAYPPGTEPDEAQLAALVAQARGVRSVSQLGVVADVSHRRIHPWAEHATAVKTQAGAAYLAPPATATPSGSESAQARSETGLNPILAAQLPLPSQGKGQGGRSGATSGATSVAIRSPRILLIDTGFKHHIARCLTQRGLEVVLAPHTVTLAQVRRLRPDGVVLSNGPGDPGNVAHLVALTRALLAERLPLMGICLGHQVLGLAIGATTSRLPFGHHGSNHPVQELRTGRVTVTSQNHNFQVDAASIPPESGFYVSHVNLSDGSVEGLAHDELPVFSVQYHPEAAPGPEDNRDLFDRFASTLVRDRVTLLAG